MFDLVHRLSALQSIASSTIASNTTVNGANSVSILGFESLTGLIRISARTDGNYTPAIQLSPDGTTFYALDAAAYIGGAAPGAISAVGDTLIGMAFISSAAAAAASVPITALLFARISITSLGVTTGATVQADLLLGHPRHSGVGV